MDGPLRGMIEWSSSLNNFPVGADQHYGAFSARPTLTLRLSRVVVGRRWGLAAICSHATATCRLRSYEGGGFITIATKRDEIFKREGQVGARLGPCKKGYALHHQAMAWGSRVLRRRIGRVVGRGDADLRGAQQGGLREASMRG